MTGELPKKWIQSCRLPSSGGLQYRSQTLLQQFLVTHESMSSRTGGLRGREGGNLHSITALWDAPLLDKTWWIALLDALQVNKIRLSTLQGAFPADKMWWSALYSTLPNKHLMSYSEDGFHHCCSYHANVQYVQQFILEFNTAAVQHRRHQHKLAALLAGIF